ncbi:MAG: nucleoside-diphosphate kinase [Planctomycetes bacterium]|nr:nucleoside-diphosphate kinase [Planctomycetota bacterium]NOG54263.1 nucleoside-diphosphate kinase [Planctomycetota bacterium]
METTLIILKPDAVQRGLMGRIIGRFEDKGLQVVGMKFMKIPQDLGQRHYEVHKGKPFYEGLLRYMTSSPVLVLALRGVSAVSITRKMMGATFGSNADPGTIRGDFGVSNSFNLVHGSDSPENAAKEVALWFGDGELVDWSRNTEGWIYDLTGEKPE